MRHHRWQDGAELGAVLVLPLIAFAVFWGVRFEPALIWPVVVYPLLEEFVFRGLVQPELAQRWPRRYGPLSVANLVTSLTFALAHLVTRGPVTAALVFLPSLGLGWVRERSGGLLWPVALHALGNLIWFTVL
jgi:membrane protease YdiL (CAAX protease family)